MLATVGDLIDDVVVRLSGPLNLASDTTARITHRRGGSAANTAATAARLGHAARFIGQVGDDPVGRSLVDELASDGVDTSCVRFRGGTGTIVVVVDSVGERHMLTDRRTSVALDHPDGNWLDAVTTLHLPMYSLSDPPLSATASTLVDLAHASGMSVSVDASSVGLIESRGADVVRALLGRLAPHCVFANEQEAEILDIDESVGGAVTVVKRGSDPATVHRPGRSAVDVPAIELAGSLDGILDTTGAGDAFAAGFLTSPNWFDDPVRACRAGHEAAARHLTVQARSFDDGIDHPEPTFA